MLEKVFITKKWAQCKTPHTLKINACESPDNKNIGKLFSKYELLFPNQANSSSDPSQIPMLQHPIPISSLPPLPSLSKPSSTIPMMLFFGFPISSYPIQPHATSIGYTEAYIKPSQANLLSCLNRS